MARNSYKSAKAKRDGNSHVALPHCVLNSAAYIGLGAHSRMLLIDLAAQYRGDNNGDLCAAWKVMRQRGWKSEDTLNRAKRELLDSMLVVETRKGARPNKCSLYALTWFALDDCNGKLDISVRAFPRGAYLLKGSPPAILKDARIASLNTAGGVKAP